ncbi:MAG: DUF1565 domain-containing protein [Cyanobacteria bacterium P01_D01_bin.56]
MDATTSLQAIRNSLKPIAGLMLVTALLVTSTETKAQTSPSTPQVLSRNQQPPNYTVLHVDAANGSDRQGTGDATKPYKTITQALQLARPGVSTVILLAPGHYSQTSGETFPLHLSPGITIQGNAGEARNTMIFGSGEVDNGSTPHSATIVTADRSGLANIAISNPKGTGVWITTGSPILRRVALVSNEGAGIHVRNSAPVIENSYFNRNQHGLVIEGDSHAVIRGNYFEATGQALSIASPATPTINNNRIARNDIGITLKNNARPILEANVLDENRRNGVVIVDPVAAAGSTPDPEQTELLAARATEVDRTALPIVPSQGSTTVSTPNVVDTETADIAAVESVPETRPGQNLAPAVAPVDTAETHTAESVKTVSPDYPASMLSTPLSPSPEHFPVIEQPVSLVTLEHTEPATDTTIHTQEVALHLSESGSPEDAIPIAVIPVDGHEIASEPVGNNERKAGISQLLARLNNRQSESITENNTDRHSAINSIEIPSQRLPVPAIAIPSARGSNQLPPPGTTSLARTFRYRVLVNMGDAEELETLVPDAFRTQVGNRTFMQAGAYVDEADAQERLEWLEDNGIDARINIRN